MPTKKQIQSWKKKIEQHMAGVAKERDKIDATIEQLEELREDCRNAYDCLEQARDALSELV